MRGGKIYSPLIDLCYDVIMIPTVAEAKAILDEEEKKPQTTKWIVHSRGVGEVVERIANTLVAKGQTLDIDRAVAMGYLHDIGKAVPPKGNHLVNGYYWLKEHGYDEDFAVISLIHHSITNDAACSIGVPPDPERDQLIYDTVRKHNFTFEERLVVLSDSLCNDVPMTFEKRVVDVITRYGVCEKTPERLIRTRELITQIEEILGHNLYDLFPEMKENL